MQLLPSLEALLRLLVPLVIIDLVDAAFTLVCSIDGLRIIVWNVRGLACLGDGIALLVDETDQLSALLVSDLHVLTDHAYLQKTDARLF